MAPGARFSFICDTDTAGRMDRVVLMADGQVVERRSAPDGEIFVVERV